jgi:Ca2+-transporting ATPase
VTYGAEIAATMAFTVFVLLQMVNVLMVRADQSTVFARRTLTNNKVWIAIGSVVLIQVLLVHVPFLESVFDTVALNGAQWAVCVAGASTLLVLHEVWVLARRGQRSLAA